MFDILNSMMGIDNIQLLKKMRESATAQTIQYTALMMLLHDKGLITKEDMKAYNKKYFPMATALIDQCLAQVDKNKEKKWREENPTEAKNLDFIASIFKPKKEEETT